MTRPIGQEADQRTPFPTARVLWAIIVIGLALGYAVAVVAGLVPEGRRIDAPALAVIGLAALCALVLLKPGAKCQFRLPVD